MKSLERNKKTAEQPASQPENFGGLEHGEGAATELDHSLEEQRQKLEVQINLLYRDTYEATTPTQFSFSKERIRELNPELFDQITAVLGKEWDISCDRYKFNWSKKDQEPEYLGPAPSFKSHNVNSIFVTLLAPGHSSPRVTQEKLTTETEKERLEAQLTSLYAAAYHSMNDVSRFHFPKSLIRATDERLYNQITSTFGEGWEMKCTLYAIDPQTHQPIAVEQDPFSKEHDPSLVLVTIIPAEQVQKERSEKLNKYNLIASKRIFEAELLKHYTILLSNYSLPENIFRKEQIYKKTPSLYADITKVFGEEWTISCLDAEGNLISREEPPNVGQAPRVKRIEIRTSPDPHNLSSEQLEEEINGIKQAGYEWIEDQEDTPTDPMADKFGPIYAEAAQPEVVQYLKEHYAQLGYDAIPWDEILQDPKLLAAWDQDQRWDNSPKLVAMAIDFVFERWHHRIFDRDRRFHENTSFCKYFYSKFPELYRYLCQESVNHLKATGFELSVTNFADKPTVKELRKDRILHKLPLITPEKKTYEAKRLLSHASYVYEQWKKQNAEQKEYIPFDLNFVKQFPQDDAPLEKFLEDYMNDPCEQLADRRTPPVDCRDFLPPEAILDWDQPEPPEWNFERIENRLQKLFSDWKDDTFNDEDYQINNSLHQFGEAYIQLIDFEFYREVTELIKSTKGTGHPLDWKDFLINIPVAYEQWVDHQIWTTELIRNYCGYMLEEWLQKKEDDPTFAQLYPRFFQDFVAQDQPEMYQQIQQRALIDQEVFRQQKTWKEYVYEADVGYLGNEGGDTKIEAQAASSPESNGKESSLELWQRYKNSIIPLRNEVMNAFEFWKRNPHVIEFSPVYLEKDHTSLARTIRNLINISYRTDLPLTWDDFLPSKSSDLQDGASLHRLWSRNQIWTNEIIEATLTKATSEWTKSSNQKTYPAFYMYLAAQYPSLFENLRRKAHNFYGGPLYQHEPVLSTHMEGVPQSLIDFANKHGESLTLYPPRYYTSPADQSIYRKREHGSKKEESQSPEFTPSSARIAVAELSKKWLQQKEGNQTTRNFSSHYFLEQDKDLYRYIVAEIKASKTTPDPLCWFDFLPQEMWGYWPSKSEKRIFQERKERQLEEFLQHAADPENKGAAAEELRALLGFFGGSKGADVLLRYLPEYQVVPHKKVRSMLSNYLGGYLLRNKPFSLDTLSRAKIYIDDLSLRDQFIQVIKNECFTRFKDAIKENPELDEQSLMQTVLQNLGNEVTSLDPDVLTEIMQEVTNYYTELHALKRPVHMIDSLKPGRHFPDVSQRINIYDIHTKKRMLIADDPGMGKSASVIMAKEMAASKTALVVVPSNVIGTWQSYLSSEKWPDGRPKGYFKDGQAPSVLVLEDTELPSPEYMSHYEYVIVSHERLTSNLQGKLEELPFDFLIIDEIHKLKNIENGVRSNVAASLAEQLERREGHLAMLSGTPIPNKIEDIAILLKLLYPERFGQSSNRALVHAILNTDTVDLRTLLLQRMQMKSLEDVEDMPELHFEEVLLELTGLEKDLYDSVMDDEEVDVAQKLTMLRQLVLNPPLEQAGQKAEVVGQDLRTFFEQKERAVLFVNGYVNQIIRGERAIIPKFNLPEDIEIAIIDGSTTVEERQAIQDRLHSRDHKMLLVVSGQTADVGVDYSPAQAVYIYNEPWTKAEIKQEIARTYRPGITEDLEVKVFITKDTVEEGMHEYITAKEEAVQKLLEAIEITERERELLIKSEQQNSENLEMNSELANYYYSSWDKMNRIFNFVKEIGEDSFREFIGKYGEEYASCYEEMGNRSYQANANRVIGTLFKTQIETRPKEEALRILDIGSGPEMLRQHLPEPYSDAVVSLDYNAFHFKPETTTNQALTGSFKQLPFKAESFDYANMNFVLHYSEFTPTRDNFERLEVLAEANRVLKVGGRLVLNTIHTLSFKNPSRFQAIMTTLGFELVTDFSGQVESGTHYRSEVVCFEKKSSSHRTVNQLVKLLETGIDQEHEGEEVEEVIPYQKLSIWEGLKFKTVKSKLHNARHIINSFTLNNQEIPVAFTQQDQSLYAEEQEIRQIAHELSNKYKGIDRIPQLELEQSGFFYYHNGKQGSLIKKLSSGEGSVMIKG